MATTTRSVILSRDKYDELFHLVEWLFNAPIPLNERNRDEIMKAEEAIVAGTPAAGATGFLFDEDFELVGYDDEGDEICIVKGES